MIKTQTDLENTQEILSMAFDNGLEVWQIEGVLNDEWLIEDYDHTISINGKRSDYIILTYEFLNSWGNVLYVIQTNDRRVYNEYVERYEEYWESLENDRKIYDEYMEHYEEYWESLEEEGGKYD